MVWIGDGPLKEAFIERASALRISDLVHIDGWRDDVEQRLQGLDIFMLTSRFEGLPLALLEAMAVGLPCIVSNVDGMPEAVEHNVSGIVCELDDHDDWCAQLVRMIECPALRQAMGAASRRRAQLRFSRERMSADTEALYMMVIARHQHADTLPAA